MSKLFTLHLFTTLFYTLIIGTLVGLNGCNSASEKSPLQIAEEDTLHLINSWRDKQNVDSLLFFLSHKNPLFRESSVAALEFVHTKTSLNDTLLSVLERDTSANVRHAAAVTLGQTYNTKLEGSLIYSLQQENYIPVKAAILEAIGKCATPEGLYLLTSLSFDNGYLEEGQAKGILHASEKGVFTPQAHQKMIRLIHPNKADVVRIIAATYLARHNTAFVPQIADALLHDPQTEVRTQAALAFTRSNYDTLALNTLLLALKTEKNNSVKEAIITALKNYQFPQAQKVVHKFKK